MVRHFPIQPINPVSSKGPSRRRVARLTWLLAAGAASGGACSRSIEVATLGERGNAPDAGCAITECGGRVFACGDCDDNDADGLSDALDPDCWGACHDSEMNWAPRQPCSNESCFFDHNCGLGNDQECVNLAPNGCDCHGCCEVAERGGAVFLGTVDSDENATCGASSVSDPAACASCVVDEQCFNSCTTGEACF